MVKLFSHAEENELLLVTFFEKITLDQGQSLTHEEFGFSTPITPCASDNVTVGSAFETFCWQQNAGDETKFPLQ